MFPTIVLKNQFGEQSNNTIIGGSSQLNCNFVVDSTNGNGLGIRSLKGSGVLNVFMHTTQTPAGGSPNPASGYIMVQLAQAYASYIDGAAGFVSPVSGTPINISSGLSIGQLYVIVSLGTSTPANFQALGLPAAVTPAVGVPFIATSASAGTGTGVVEIPKSSGAGANHIEIVGDPNLTSNVSTGALILLQCMGAGAGALTMNSYTPAGTNDSSTPPIFTGTPATLTGSVASSGSALAAPADGTVIGLTFNMIPNAGSPL